MDPNNPSTQEQAPLEVIPPAQHQIKTTPNNSRKKIIIIGAIGLLLLITLASFFIFLSNNGSKEQVDILPSPTVKPTLIPFPPEGEYVEGSLIVEYQEGSNPDEVDSVESKDITDKLNELGVERQEKTFDSDSVALKNFYTLYFKEGEEVAAVAQKIYSLPFIKSIEFNTRVKTN